jgi:hypothetical protein
MGINLHACRFECMETLECINLNVLSLVVTRCCKRMKCWKSSTTIRLNINTWCEDQLDVCRSKSVPNLVITNWCYFKRANIWKNVTSKNLSYVNLNVLLNVNEVIYFSSSSSHTCFTTWSISPWRLQCCQTSSLVHVLTQISFVIGKERQRQAHMDN